MQFTARDFTNQFISQSYQDVLQQFITASNTVYILDGLGNIFLTIPSSSLGQSIITSDQVIPSGSYALSASYSDTASYAKLVGYNTISSSYSVSPLDGIIYVNVTSSVVVTLPAPNTVSGQLFRIKKVDSTGYEVIISSSVNIDYDRELRLSQRGSSVTLHSDSTQYWIH